MVVSKIIGGLGNQMFQYAAGACTAADWGVDFKIDISAFKDYKLHNGFEIQKVFNVQPAIATQLETLRMTSGTKTYFEKILKKFGFSRSCHYVEPSFSYREIPRNSKSEVYLDGYWQTEKYFLNRVDLVKSLFTFRNSLSDRSDKFLSDIRSTEAISLHVRRGDYVSNKSANIVHGVLGVGYYKEAMRIVESKISNPKYFIFSDDIEWCKNNLSLASRQVVFVEGNSGLNSWEDMQLMSECKHNIIANSSFSWWGAWLNRNQAKIVIAPDAWFQTQDKDQKDILPPTWIRVSSDFYGSIQPEGVMG